MLPIQPRNRTLACLIRQSDKLQGFTIPGSDEWLTVNLFADDTVVYANEYDRFDDLQEILDKWCRVSGAKFNKEKTEIIPLGIKAHRTRITQTRKLHPMDTPLNLDIHITKDREAICSLGSWVGNDASNNTPWEPVIVLRSGRAYGLTEAFLARRRFLCRCSRYCCRRCWVRLGPSVGKVYVLGAEGYSGQNRGNTDWEA